MSQTGKVVKINLYQDRFKFATDYISPLGKIILSSDGARLTGLWFEGQKYFPLAVNSASEEAGLPIFIESRKWLDSYFSGKDPGTPPDLSLEGSEFQLAVWEILRGIAYGKTLSYKEVASVVAESRNLRSMSAQAVGTAVGHNPVSLMIPCHRVTGSKGDLRGYASGLERKKWLLEMEKSVIETLSP